MGSVTLKISSKDYSMHLHFPRLLWTYHFFHLTEEMCQVQGFVQFQHNQNGLKRCDLGPCMHKTVEKSLFSFLSASRIVLRKHSLAHSREYHSFLSR